MDEVGRDGMAPMLPGILGWIGLVEQVPMPLPVAQAVRVVEHGLRVDVVIGGAMWVIFVGCP